MNSRITLCSTERRPSTGGWAIIHAMGFSSFRAIIQFGLLLLIATPIARVTFSLVGFAMERDWTYAVITAIVLAILIFALA